MITKLADISKVIDGLTLKDWERLFELIPEIEKTKDFIKGGGIIDDPNDPEGFMITPIVEADIVQVFEKMLYDLSLIIDFNWPGWDEGRTIADDQDFENKDTVTLLKLFTAFVRNNRFCDGVLAAKFEDKTIEKILKQLKKNIESR